MRSLKWNRRGATFVVAATASLACLLLAPATQAEEQITYGKTYAQWSAQWWQWAYSISKADDDPISGLGAVDCGRGQKGPVFFLAGLPANYDNLPDEFTELSGARECSVPVGKPFFFPLVNAAYYNGPGETATVAEKREALDYVMVGARFFCGATVAIDGSLAYQLPTARVQSPTFLAKPVADNVFAMPLGTNDPKAVSDGFWMMVPPLSKGHHTVMLSGIFCKSADTGNPASQLIPWFSVNMHYDLTVGK